MIGHAGLVDAMAHVDDARVLDLGAWLRTAAAHGVSDVVCAGVDPRMLTLERLLRRDNLPAAPRLWRAVGLHPRWVSATDLPAQLAALYENLVRGSAPRGKKFDGGGGNLATALGLKASGEMDRDGCDDSSPALPHAVGLVGVGEIGLDGRNDSPPAALQEEAFVQQLRLARRHALPVILHCVHRIGRLVEILEAEGGAPHGAVLHGFAGPSDWVARLVALNVSFSFGGLLLNPGATRCHAAAVVVPEARLLVETDAPERDPAHLPRLIDVLATLRGTDGAAIATLTARNARRLYKMPTLNTRSS